MPTLLLHRPGTVLSSFPFLGSKKAGAVKHRPFARKCFVLGDEDSMNMDCLLIKIMLGLMLIVIN